MKRKNEFNLILVSLICLSFPLESFAATYNLYFNNTEQGDNSTATPNVYVKDGKKAQEVEDEVEADAPEEAAVPAKENAKPVAAPEKELDTYPAITPNTSVSAVRGRMVEEKPKFRRFRFFGGAGTVTGHYETSGSVFNNDPNSTLPFWEQKTAHTLPSSSLGVGFSVGFIPSLALTLTAGSISAIEFEVSPLGRGKHFFEPVLFTGFSGALFSEATAVAPHVGGRLILNVSDPIGIHATARKSLTGSNPGFQYTQVEVGVLFSI